MIKYNARIAAATFLGLIALHADAAPDISRIGRFADISPREVLSASYPGLTSDAARLADTGEWLEVDELRDWTHRGSHLLLGIVGRWSGDESERWVTANNGAFTCDLVVLARDGSRVRLVAKADAAASCGGATSAGLDLARYDMDAGARLIGVRSRSMNHGYGEEFLTLYKLEGTRLVPVFGRLMGTEDGNTGAITSAILQVEKASPGPNVFVVVEGTGRHAKRERWVWTGSRYEPEKP
jgi:hypothetical protein